MARGELGILRLPWSLGWVLDMGLHPGMKLSSWDGRVKK